MELQNLPKPEDLLKIDLQVCPKHPGWTLPPISGGNVQLSCINKSMTRLGIPNPREWNPAADDWKLPDNWQDIIMKGFKERLENIVPLSSSNVCVRCGACMDKCHFLPRFRRSQEHAGAQGRAAQISVQKRFHHSGQAASKSGRVSGIDSRRAQGVVHLLLPVHGMPQMLGCFCPYGIDTAEVTMIARNCCCCVGITINWILQPAADCFRTGNHLGIPPHCVKDMWEFMTDDIEDVTGIRVNLPINKKVVRNTLRNTFRRDYFADPARTPAWVT